MSTEWIPLSDLANWTQAIGRLARTGDGVVGTILYFHFDHQIRVTLATGQGLITVLVDDCQVLARKEVLMS